MGTHAMFIPLLICAAALRRRQSLSRILGFTDAQNDFPDPNSFAKAFGTAGAGMGENFNKQFASALGCVQEVIMEMSKCLGDDIGNTVSTIGSERPSSVPTKLDCNKYEKCYHNAVQRCNDQEAGNKIKEAFKQALEKANCENSTSSKSSSVILIGLMFVTALAALRF